MTSNQPILSPDFPVTNAPLPELDALWIMRCKCVDIDRTDGISMQHGFDPVTQTHWLIRRAHLTTTAACERLRGELALTARLDRTWALLPCATIWTAQQMICVYRATESTRVAAHIDGSMSLMAFLDLAAG